MKNGIPGLALRTRDISATYIKTCRVLAPLDKPPGIYLDAVAQPVIAATLITYQKGCGPSSEAISRRANISVNLAATSVMYVLSTRWTRGKPPTRSAGLAGAVWSVVPQPSNRSPTPSQRTGRTMELVSTIVQRRRSFSGQGGWTGRQWTAYSRLHHPNFSTARPRLWIGLAQLPLNHSSMLEAVDGKDINGQAPSDAVQAPSAAKCRERRTKLQPANEMMKVKVTVEGKAIQDS
jgi:hypothetical protein